MVVDDFYIVCVAALPDEADAPLIIDSNAVLACPITGELLEPRGRRCIGYTQVVQGRRGIQHFQFPLGPSLDLRRKSSTAFALENPLGPIVGKRLDHARTLARLNALR